MRAKEFLSSQQIDHESVNVEDGAGMDLLRDLGADSVPVVSRGGQFVYAQSIGDVADFLGLDVDAGPTLSPPELVEKLDMVLAAAQRFWRQMPDDALTRKLPNRDRTYRVLAHHIFRIPEAFLEMTEGATLTYELLTSKPPENIQTVEQVTAYGQDIRDRLKSWWRGLEDVTGDQRVPTYYGEQPLHEVLERTTWHAAQHVRQTMMILEQLGITPEQPLTADDLAGLPVPEKVWDDEPGASAN
ncbi:MAG: DinB family protein [Alphaproteobacteria bacterium]|nr:DinB family protein [Alphaproteobacteria bacterium]